MINKEHYEMLKKIPGIVWKKSENYQKAYRLVPFEAPEEWLDMQVTLGEQHEEL